jgi:hypothetical protein
VAAFQRTQSNEIILAIHNLSHTQQSVSQAIRKPIPSMTDLLTGKEFTARNERIDVELEPYQYLWLKES